MPQVRESTAQSPRALGLHPWPRDAAALAGSRGPTACSASNSDVPGRPVDRVGPGDVVGSTGGRVDISLAVNGTLMRGLELNGNMLKAGARSPRGRDCAGVSPVVDR